MSQPVRLGKAQRTGQIHTLDNGNIIYEVKCMSCQMTQWHNHGLAHCIKCNARFRVGLDLVDNPGKKGEASEE